MANKTWFDRFFDEKGIDRDDIFEIETEDSFHIVDYGFVIDCIKQTGSIEKLRIKNMLVKIDFANGDVKHYLRHLAQALV